MYTAADPTANDITDTTDPTPTSEVDSLESIMQSAIVSGIKDDIFEKGKRIDGKPSRAMLDLLSNAVLDGTCTATCKSILIHDCGPEGLALAEELVKKGY
jgi:hypothetical protein